MIIWTNRWKSHSVGWFEFWCGVERCQGKSNFCDQLFLLFSWNQTHYFLLSVCSSLYNSLPVYLLAIPQPASKFMRQKCVYEIRVYCIVGELQVTGCTQPTHQKENQLHCAVVEKLLMLCSDRVCNYDWLTFLLKEKTHSFTGCVGNLLLFCCVSDKVCLVTY